MKTIKTGIILLVSLVVLSCTKPVLQYDNRGIYYWKTVFNISERDNVVFKKLKIDKLYLRITDVIFDEKNKIPVPSAPVVLDSKIPDGMELVPVVFIVPDVFKKISDHQAKELAINITNACFMAGKAAGKAIEEIQIDYDWTPSTRERYFYFLECLKKEIETQKFAADLSCTLRLHQVKYMKKTGVPPVNRTSLMLYNMVDSRKVSGENTIYSLKEMKKYTSSIKKYPIKMDLIFPVFSETLIYRNNHLAGMMNLHDPERLKDSENFKKSGKDTFISLKSNVYGGYELNAGDVIKAEKPDLNEVRRGALLLAGNKIQWGSLSFYDYDPGEGLSEKEMDVIGNIFGN